MTPEELARRVERLELDQGKLHEEIDELREEARKRELSRLRWGIGVLGGIVMALVSWVWAQAETAVHLTFGGPKP